MSRYYVACELGTTMGRVLVGTLHRELLTVSELRRFENLPILEKGTLQWDIPQLYRAMLEGLSAAGSYDEPVDGVSFTSWGGDYLLFDHDGSLITPAYSSEEPAAGSVPRRGKPILPPEAIYEETGVWPAAGGVLAQLSSEAHRRIKRARLLLPIADGFNFLLTGSPRVERSLASTTQLYNPVTGDWSERLLQAFRLPPSLFPPLVAAGTDLGPIRPDLAKHSNLSEARVVASCSHELAAALLGLPLVPGENWAFIRPGAWTVLGTQAANPIITPASFEMKLSNQAGYGGSISFHKQDIGLWILDECQRFWEREGRLLDTDLLSHLAGSSPPFESLIDLSDPRFLVPGDMPAKIQAFCKETGQPVPRKPGPIFRCILESLALLYRQSVYDMERLTGERIQRLYLLDGGVNSLLNHFIANALELPVVIAPANVAAIGNVVAQALALGHIGSIAEAREIVRRSFKTETLLPQPAAWNVARYRFAALSGVVGGAA